MRTITTILLSVVLFGVTYAQNDNSFVELGGELRLPLPQGWTNAGSDQLYPFQLIDTESPSELLIFKSVLVPGEAIRSRNEFRASVDDVIDSIVLTLPEATLLTTTGVDETSHAGFVLEFTSIDTSSGLLLRHRLAGILYRDHQNRQILFTLWGRTGADLYNSIANDLITMQSGIVYLGQTEDDVFGKTATNETLYYLMLVAMLAILFVLRQRRKKLYAKTSSNPRAWRCECGRINNVNFSTCRHCDQPRPNDNN